jgi:hypothetical protein
VPDGTGDGIAMPGEMRGERRRAVSDAERERLARLGRIYARLYQLGLRRRARLCAEAEGIEEHATEEQRAATGS